MTTFACNPDESAGLAEQFSVKVNRYVALHNGHEIAECDTKEAIGTMLAQLDEDGEIVTCLWDRELRRRLVG